MFFFFILFYYHWVLHIKPLNHVNETRYYDLCFKNVSSPKGFKNDQILHGEGVSEQENHKTVQDSGVQKAVHQQETVLKGLFSGR